MAPEESEVTDASDQDSPEDELMDDSTSETAEEEEDETQADEDTEEEDTGDESEEEEESEEDAPAKGRSPAFQKLLDKYGGDEDALVNAYFEQANSSSRLHKEFEELKDYLLREKEDNEDPEAVIAEDPQVVRLTSRMNSLQNNIKAIQQEQMQLIGEYGNLEQEAKALEAQVKSAEDFEKAALRAELGLKQSEMRRIKSEVLRGRRELDGETLKVEDIEVAMNKARESVLERREQARKDKLKSDQTARLTREEFNQAMRAEAKVYGIDPSSKQFAILNTSIRNQIANHLGRLPKDGPGIDIAGATKRLMQEYADAWGMKPKFSKVSAAKKKARTPMNAGQKRETEEVEEPKLPKGIQKFDKQGRWTREYVDARANRLLGIKN